MLIPLLAPLLLLGAPAASPSPSPPINPGMVTSPGARVGPEDLRLARELLDRARGHMEPRQWELLDGKVAQAQRALDEALAARRAAQAVRAAEAARAARIAEGAAEAGRASEVIEAAPRLALRAAVAPEVAALLAALVFFWPSTAEAPTLPPSQQPKTEYEAKLRAVAVAAQQVREEIERTAQPAAMQPTEGAPKQAIKEDRTPDWKEACIAYYRLCIDTPWVARWSCHDCFRYCEGQHKWPFNMCYPPKRRRR